MITLLVMTDGRKQFIEPTLERTNMLSGYISRKLIHDDSGDESYRKWLLRRYGKEYEIYSTGRRSGFGGAIISAWNQLQNDNNDWVFHLEDDFVMSNLVPLSEMITVMNRNPHIVQMALRRQPWNEVEKAAGGIVEADPDSYEEKTNGIHTWLEHRKFFTTNPSLYRKSLTVEHPWPVGLNSEGKFGIELFNDADKRSAFWGYKGEEPRCWHIGEFRNGAGY